eukprot:CAMPEP_0119324982 /NCGR_PEP_ID=MMETSP1333-20130426/64644_1 /TAXON_ID=418940 /ORGANISM="Scyphosphaera apsteinii, Strain RCC1455" /LENGTH=361 /DNA_ID=CAMNT_0007332827 /DNA_START=149 /DNA_END=1235 /DNA_ORIENTATION=-
MGGVAKVSRVCGTSCKTLQQGLWWCKTSSASQAYYVWQFGSQGGARADAEAAIVAQLATAIGEKVFDEPSVLEFIGLGCSISLAPTKAVHVSMLPQVAESGDVMVFRTKAPVAALQRAVTISKWDHVGLVVHRDRCERVTTAANSHEVGFVECDMNGCRFYSLNDYTQRQWHQAYESMALRQVEWPGRGTSQAADVLEGWCNKVLGKPYLLTPAKIASAARTSTGDKDAMPRGFFCSELAAHGLQELGLLSAERAPAGYWPAHFAENSRVKLPLIGGATIGEELLVEFRTPGLDMMRQLPASEASSPPKPSINCPPSALQPVGRAGVCGPTRWSLERSTSASGSDEELLQSDRSDCSSQNE